MIKTEEDVTPDGRWRLVTVLPTGRVVSTVHLSGGNFSGLEGMHPGGDFETMVFVAKDRYSDLACERDTSKQDAANTHARFVEEWKSGDPY